MAKASPPGSITSSDCGGPESKTPAVDAAAAPPTAPALATQENQRMEAALGDAILRFFRIRKGPKGDEYELDAVRSMPAPGGLLLCIMIATQPSIWDSANVEEYKCLYIHPQCENWSAFDPNFRWTWREERETRRKVDWKIMVRDPAQLSLQQLPTRGERERERMEPELTIPATQLWACIMFAALNIIRNNISNATTWTLGFGVIDASLLSIPHVVGSCLTMLVITAVSELLDNRSFVAMAEDAWLLPCFVALLALPDPIGSWAYFAIATVLLSFPYTHPIQVAWTSRNAGSVQNRTVSASLYTMWVQVSGMIGANNRWLTSQVYQPSDSPRYFKANTGLLVICVWMCVSCNLFIPHSGKAHAESLPRPQLVQYPATYFYYNWRNKSKAKKWDAMNAGAAARLPRQHYRHRKQAVDFPPKMFWMRSSLTFLFLLAGPISASQPKSCDDAGSGDKMR
ncbi:putative transporter [Colletotrichum tanaceti]|uniref:Putative transporter n=1 Tax=Colletotrichum tanaceti TaxID=1306861 RepID=A0A4U6X9K4_9PEZI|nr:putative transporter [Colletotrichum tanaceti]